MRLHWSCLWVMAILICACGSMGKGDARELIVLGGEQGNPWQGGGGGIDPVIILGQAFGTLVYVRNIMFRRRESGAQAVGGGDGAT